MGESPFSLPTRPWRTGQCVVFGSGFAPAGVPAAIAQGCAGHTPSLHARVCAEGALGEGSLILHTTAGGPARKSMLPPMTAADAGRPACKKHATPNDVTRICVGVPTPPRRCEGPPALPAACAARRHGTSPCARKPRAATPATRSANQPAQTRTACPQPPQRVATGMRCSGIAQAAQPSRR